MLLGEKEPPRTRSGAEGRKGSKFAIGREAKAVYLLYRYMRANLG